MAYLQPLNPFQEKPAGLDAMRLNTPAISSPQAFAPAPTLSMPVAQSSQAQSQNALGYLAPVMSGLAAGSQAQPTTNAQGAIMQTIGSGVTGAGGGALAGAAIGAAGGPVGALGGAAIGGLVSLVSGGIQSYFGLRQARAQKREQERLIAEINRKEEERFQYQKELNAQARSDNQENIRYNRRQAALSSQFNAFNSVLALLNNAQAQDQNMKNLFIQQGR